MMEQLKKKVKRYIEKIGIENTIIGSVSVILDYTIHYNPETIIVAAYSYEKDQKRKLC